MSYKYIYNPKTMKKYSINSNNGIKIINLFLKEYEGGSIFSRKKKEKTLTTMINSDEEFMEFKLSIPNKYLSKKQQILLKKGKKLESQFKKINNITQNEMDIYNQLNSTHNWELDNADDELEKMHSNIIHQYFPIVSFYVFDNNLFIRPAYNNIDDAFSCSSKKNLAGSIAQIIEPFSNTSPELYMDLYLYCVQILRDIIKRHCNSKKKCKNYCK